MKVSYDWLQTFFDGNLPSVDAVGDALMFHSWELEDVVSNDGDSVLDVNVLPDKSAWALSHRGIAKDLSVVLGIPLTRDPLHDAATLQPRHAGIEIQLQTPTCTRYSAALVRGVSVGPSPAWLQKRLAALGQRSINNVVDITNYVMFDLGQPLHAYDAGKLGGVKIVVRSSRSGEEITTLTGETYTLSSDDAVIADGTTDAAIGIAGIKGGMLAEVEDATVDILLEAGNFVPVPVRKTAQRIKLRTDASARYENGIVPEMTAYGLTAAVALLQEIAGGTLEGYADTGAPERVFEPVTVPISKINSVLGLNLTEAHIRDILNRFGYAYTVTDRELTVTPPFERTDLSIPEDIIEEVGRIHGYADVPSIVPEPIALEEHNKRFFYSEVVRDVLTAQGFSEIYTSSFRNSDEVQLANALAADKGYLRSDLRQNMEEALIKNVPHEDLLGIPFVGAFEIGTVFRTTGEHFSVVVGVRHGAAYKEKMDQRLLAEALSALEAKLGPLHANMSDGIAEFNFDAVLDVLPEPDAYAPFDLIEDVTYAPFSPYPSISRDIAFWIHDNTPIDEIESLLQNEAGALCVRITLFDEFSKDGRTSYAFRLVFQSEEKTLTDEEVNAVMEPLYRAVEMRGWETR